MQPWRIVHTEASEGLGGQELRVLAELQWMRAQGHAVWLSAPPHAKIFERAAAAGIPVEPLDTRRWKLPSEVFRFASWLRANRIDVLNTHSSRDAWIGGLAGRFARTPLVIRSRHIEVAYPHRWQSALINDAWADAVVTTSERISQGLIRDLQLDPARVQCIPTGIDLQKFNPEVTSALRAELGIALDVPLVGMVSVIRSWKGHPILFTAAQKVLEKIPNAQFLIVGDGPCMQWYPDQVRELGLADKIRFLGHREDVPNVLAALDVVVLPSTAHEGIPQILLQAQASGKAIAASRVGGIPEIIEDQKTGLLVPPKDPDALAEALMRLLGDKALRDRLGHAAALYAREHHSCDRMGEKLEVLYRAYLVD